MSWAGLVGRDEFPGKRLNLDENGPSFFQINFHLPMSHIKRNINF